MPVETKVAIGPKGSQRVFTVRSTENALTVTMEGRPGTWSYPHATGPEVAQETVALMIQDLGRACWSAAVETCIHSTAASLNELR
jgi:hypothetical protein